MSHRGPDGCGLAGWDDHGRFLREGRPLRIGLAHRRLSIIDLSEAGEQPMSNEDGHVWITYNGEFYNFQDYRRELEEQGHSFRSRCDTEMIVHLYEEVGIETTLNRMNGMFAFGLYDVRKRQLVLARDRAGKKPLYYAHLPDGSLVFASEIKSLLASGLLDPSRRDETALDQIWSFGYSTGERTLFAQVRKLLPAHYLVWEDGRITIRRYWDCPFQQASPREGSEEELTDELDEVLTDAVRLRLIADVPIGVFLSGGIDSSLIAALAAKVTGRQIRAYTVGFTHADFDESVHAAGVAKAVGIDSHVLMAKDDVLKEATAVARHFDEPFGDSSALPSWMVSKLARSHVTVALTGDGGDELFAGYESFRQGQRIWGARPLRRRFRRSLTAQEQLWIMKLRAMGFARGYPLLEQEVGWRIRRRLFDGSFRRRNAISAAYTDRHEWIQRMGTSDLLTKMQALVFHTWLPDDFLRKVDTASMAHSLETRCPLLDYRVVAFAARLPFDAKFDEYGRGKKILRRLLARYVPPHLFERPKQGFSVPWERWCTGAMADQYRHLWTETAPEPFQRHAAELLFPREGEGSRFLKWLAFCTLTAHPGDGIPRSLPDAGFGEATGAA